jgi:hypothetical protein
MLFVFVLLFTAIGGLLVLVVSMIMPLPTTVYKFEARKEAVGQFFVTGSVPSSVTVIGRNIPINPADINIAEIGILDRKVIDHRRLLIEQALVNVCITLQATCDTQANHLVWAFLEDDSGPVSDIWSGATRNTINCATATQTEYMEFGKHLIRQSFPLHVFDSPVVLNGITKTFYYSRPRGAPIGGEGCSFTDIVSLM